MGSLLVKQTVDYSNVTDRAIVPGFSERFNYFLDQAGIEKANRFASGSRLFDVTLNTFRHWCINNKPPRHFIDLKEIVDCLKPDISTLYSQDSIAIVAWLLCGDHVPNPFKNVSNGFFTDLILLINRIATLKGLPMDSFSKEDRDSIIQSASHYLKKEFGSEPEREKLENNPAFEEVIGQILNLKKLGVM